MKTRITIMAKKKIAAILPMFSSPRKALNSSCNDDELYREGLGQL